MKINLNRVLQDMDVINAFGVDEKGGCNRLSYSAEDTQARTYLLSELAKLDALITIDPVGNIRAKIPGKHDLPSIASGSHIDTVRSGGRFDGLIGVLLTLEAMRVIKENDVLPNRPIELMIFAEEEGSNFGSTMLGSKAMCGLIREDDLKRITDDGSISAFERMKKVGLHPEHLDEYAQKDLNIAAMLEIHIEQGEILESEGKHIGIVEAIVGMKTVCIRYQGISNHAGATPMWLRKDPMCAAAELILFAENFASSESTKTSVATVGKIHSKPNSSNVIPSEVEIYLDIRDDSEEEMERIVEHVRNQHQAILNRRGLQGSFRVIGESKPVHLDAKVVTIIEKLARVERLSYMRMNSGAVHDAAMLATRVPVGMIFLPSIQGRSHCPEENTTDLDLEMGGNLLLRALLTLSEE